MRNQPDVVLAGFGILLLIFIIHSDEEYCIFLFTELSISAIVYFAI